MGLDMYLDRRFYIKNSDWNGNWDWDNTGTHSHLIQPTNPHIKEERLKEFTEEIAYWRKANHIHKWFVDNVQQGIDNCEQYPVTLEQLRQLADTCSRVLNSSQIVEQTMMQTIPIYDQVTKTLTSQSEPVQVKVLRNDMTAQALLPTTAGFFFGGTWYDTYYLETTQYTYDTLTQFLKDEEEDKLQMEEWRSTLYYQSSW